MKDPDKPTGADNGGMGATTTESYVLKLCISGMTRRSQQALANLGYICDKFLSGRYQLEVIDLYRHPELAAQFQVVATPTLIKDRPLPLRHLIGDLSDTVKTLQLLGLPVAHEGSKGEHEVV